MVLEEHPFLDDEEEEEENQGDTAGREGGSSSSTTTPGSSSTSSSSSSSSKGGERRQRPRRPLHIPLVENEEEGYRISVRGREGGKEGGMDGRRERGRDRGRGVDNPPAPAHSFYISFPHSLVHFHLDAHPSICWRHPPSLPPSLPPSRLAPAGAAEAAAATATAYPYSDEASAWFSAGEAHLSLPPFLPPFLPFLLCVLGRQGLSTGAVRLEGGTGSPFLPSFLVLLLPLERSAGIVHLFSFAGDGQ